MIDSAAGGPGGCPYAPRATNNVATEDVVYMLEGMGTGVDMANLLAATNAMSRLLGRPPGAAEPCGRGAECEDVLTGWLRKPLGFRGSSKRRN